MRTTASSLLNTGSFAIDFSAVSEKRDTLVDAHAPTLHSVSSSTPASTGTSYFEQLAARRTPPGRPVAFFTVGGPKRAIDSKAATVRG